MSTGHALLGLLEERPRHGYELKHLYDRLFPNGRELRFGQVYASLSRLLRDGFVVVDAVEREEGPDRKRYAITSDGVARLEEWLLEPVDPRSSLQSTQFTKVVLALLSGRPAEEILDAQRSAHLKTMRELTRKKTSGDVGDALASDFALFHLEADLRWIELTGARLDMLRKELEADG
ncbi:MAG TPA: PadR family transcriptional regulator [Actinomycetota bacterium]|nr:PadR family transcriptional regulator [Actinomycetota bacterium]